MLESVELFIEVANTRGFRQAGQNLQISGSTVSRRIAELERDIGLALVKRTTRQVELTEAGELLLEGYERIAAEELELREKLSGRLLRPHGLLRVAAPQGYALVALGRVLPAFCKRYPEIRIELDLNAKPVDLVADACDLVICAGEPERSSVVARKVGTAEMGLYASPRYLEGRGVPQTPQDLARHDMPIPRPLQISLLPVGGGAPVPIEPKGRVMVNSTAMLDRLAQNHMGIVIIGDVQATPLVEEGKLARVLPGWTLSMLEFHALTLSRKVPARVRVFVDFLVERLQPAADRAAPGTAIVQQ